MQKSVICSRVAMMASQYVDPSLLQEAGKDEVLQQHSETVLQCEKKFSGSEAYIYYDASRQIWKVGVELGSDGAQLVVHSDAKTPEDISSVWSVASEGGKWEKART